MSYERVDMSGNLADFTYTGPTELKAERSAKEVLLSNLSSAVSLLMIMAIFTWIILVVPVAVIVYRVAFG